MISDSGDLQLIGKIYTDCIKEMYFYYMSHECDCGKCGNIDHFTYAMMAITYDLIEELHNKYADHVEGIKRK